MPSSTRTFDAKLMVKVDGAMMELPIMIQSLRVSYLYDGSTEVEITGWSPERDAWSAAASGAYSREEDPTLPGGMLSLPPGRDVT